MTTVLSIYNSTMYNNTTVLCTIEIKDCNRYYHFFKFWFSVNRNGQLFTCIKIVVFLEMNRRDLCHN